MISARGLRLDNVGVVTRDLDASVDFYTRLLGFEVISQDRQLGRAAIQLQGTVLYLLSTTSADQVERSADPAENAAGLDHLSFATPDVDETHRALARMGVEFFLLPQDAGWGARVCGCRDPSGTPIYFLRWLGSQ